MTDSVIDLLQRAQAAADGAAARAGVEVRLLEEVAEHKAAAALFAAVWRTEPQSEPVNSDLLRGLAHVGNYVAGAFRDGRLVGASAGFLAGVNGDLHLHSHVTAVATGLQGRSVGFALKQHQRAWALAGGLSVVTWTFDPLVRRNGWFNLNKLGAIATTYIESFYGEMSDGINAGDDSDRCVVTWKLVGSRAARASMAAGLEPPTGDGAAVLLEEDDIGAPRTRPATGDVLVVCVPADIVALRASDPARAWEWRCAVRDTMGSAMGDGFVATGVTGWGGYLLEWPRRST